MTTAHGIVLICLGGVGLAMSVFVLLGLSVAFADVAPDSPELAGIPDRALASGVIHVLTKLGLIGIGTLMLRRSRAALPSTTRPVSTSSVQSRARQPT